MKPYNALLSCFMCVQVPLLCYVRVIIDYFYLILFHDGAFLFLFFTLIYQSHSKQIAPGMVHMFPFLFYFSLTKSSISIIAKVNLKQLTTSCIPVDLISAQVPTCNLSMSRIAELQCKMGSTLPGE